MKIAKIEKEIKYGKLGRFLKGLDLCARYAAVGVWAFCLFTGGYIAIAAAVLGVLVCAVECL